MKKFMLITVTFILIGSFFWSGCQKSAGLQMVQYPVKDDPTVSFRLWFKVGSMNDPVGKEGLAALTANMITRGATQKHSLEEITDLLYPMAAGINNQVDKEMTIIYGRTHKDNLKDYYAILKEVVMEPAFKEEDFERIKTNTLNYLEKTLRYADDEELGKEVLSEFVYIGTTYQHIEEGYVSGLKNITLDDVKSFYRKLYTRGNLVIGIGGGYDAAFAEQVKKDFSQLPPGASKEVPKP
ncbi:MAG TPA: insulinase family protein, partial [Caldithrix sp.]|nr:insulinase family protein [Caldithrix sp.]